MPTEEEISKIRLSGIYNSKEQPKPPEKKSLFEGFTKLLQTTTIAIGIFLSIDQYRKNSDSERRESARDYQKTFYQAQMNVYMDIVNSTSILVTADPQTVEYSNGREKFFELFWGKLGMFENKCVEAKTVLFRKLLFKFETKDYSPLSYCDPCTNITCNYDTVTQITLKFASLQLAHECRLYTIQTWLPEIEQAQYNLKDSIACSSKH